MASIRRGSRKHAISLCFTVNVGGIIDVRADGEGIKFQWFSRDQLSGVRFWPGSDRLVKKLIEADDLDSTEILANRRTIYSALSARALNHNALVWQTPALALAAEAFLLTIALNPLATMLARMVAAGLNLMLSILCLQLMTKHRAMVVFDREAMVAIESSMGMNQYHGRLSPDALSWFARQRSGDWWRGGFLVLALVSVAILVLSVVQVGLQI